jgi:hypothetical protein
MILSVIISVALFISLLLGLELGRAYGRKWRCPEASNGGGTAAADGVVFAVLGLLIAFIFTASAARFDTRRELIVQQANAVSTMWLRLDLLSPEDRDVIRGRIQQWTALVAQTAEKVKDPAHAQAFVAEAAGLQGEVWKLTIEAIERDNDRARAIIILTPINEWIDLSTTRSAQNAMGLPPMVLPTLIALALLSSVLAGHHMSHNARRSVLHMLIFAAVVTLAIYGILDLNNPREGLISVEAVDQTMIDLNRSFEQQLSGAR